MAAPPAWRPVVLLDAWRGAGSGAAGWSLGRREAALLDLRRVLFGEKMESLAACPECGEWLEFTVQPADLLAAAPPENDSAHPLAVTAAGVYGNFRLPTTEDLVAAAVIARESRRHWLLSRCSLDAAPPDGGWPDAFVTAVAEKMAAADPLGDVTLSLDCNACGHSWSAPFDTGTFLWAELSAWATRLMSEVHLLATSYGWTEREIVSLPPHRREYYLERAGRS